MCMSEEKYVDSIINHFSKFNEANSWDGEKMAGVKALGEVLDCDYKTIDVEKTKYCGANIRAILNEFNKEDFKNKSTDEIFLLCDEVGQRVAKQLKIKPFKMDISVGQNAKGIDYLFEILKNSFLSYQNQNLANLASGQDFDKYAVIGAVQEAVLTSDEGSCERKESLQNLTKTESELFAYEMMSKFRSKGLEFNQESIKHLQKNDNLNFSKEVFDKEKVERMQDMLKDGYYNIKQTYNKNKDITPKGQAFCLDMLFSNLKEEDFDEYFSDFESKIKNFQNFSKERVNEQTK
jgi:hypothetical protein